MGLCPCRWELSKKSEARSLPRTSTTVDTICAVNTNTPHTRGFNIEEVIKILITVRGRAVVWDMFNHCCDSTWRDDTAFALSFSIAVETAALSLSNWVWTELLAVRSFSAIRSENGTGTLGSGGSPDGGQRQEDGDEGQSNGAGFGKRRRRKIFEDREDGYS